MSFLSPPYKEALIILVLTTSSSSLPPPPPPPHLYRLLLLLLIVVSHGIGPVVVRVELLASFSVVMRDVRINSIARTRGGSYLLGGRSAAPPVTTMGRCKNSRYAPARSAADDKGPASRARRSSLTTAYAAGRRTPVRRPPRRAPAHRSRRGHHRYSRRGEARATTPTGRPRRPASLPPAAPSRRRSGRSRTGRRSRPRPGGT